MKFNKAKSKGLHLPRDSPRHQHGVGEELRAALQRTWGWRKSCTELTPSTGGTKRILGCSKRGVARVR